MATMNNLAALYVRQGSYADAEASYVQVLEIRRRVQGQEHPNTLATMNMLTKLYCDQGKYRQAEALSRVAVKSMEKTPDLRRRYDSQSLLEASLAGQKKYADAEPLLVSGYEPAFPPCRKPTQLVWPFP